MNGCFFHYAQSLWRKLQQIGMSRYFLPRNANSNNNNISDAERKKTDDWFLGVIGLALTPADIVESTWTDIIDLYIPDDVNATEFNDYLV
ncbi:unnamed protein product [Didymodactylos carnosus]|uniref:Uncharacterized protein n=1 Tax=Didymodactylos carnosus TaxID=1234261 RepID=A0A816C864_9BILA|nr:unnamed protein product [Didymodactylos carnosus]CAF4506374.1 unnamed protein product [Didymodactylos carnosus]